MKNPYLISLRPDTSSPTIKCVSAIGEGQAQLVASLAAPIVATPTARYNLMRNPCAENDGQFWTFTNCIFSGASIADDGTHSMIVGGLGSTSVITSPVCRFKGSGPHTMSINLRNYSTSAKTATVTFMINLRADGSDIGGVVNPVLTLSVPALGNVAFTQTVTPGSPWFAIKIDNLSTWSPVIEVNNPMVNPGSTLDSFFSYKTKARQGLPNPGKVDSSGYRFTTSWSLASASDVGWMFHPVARQWAVNSYFRAGTTGYTVTNCTAALDTRYKVYSNLGSLGMTASAANARIAQTITVTAGLRAVFMAYVLNRNAASRTVQLRAGGTVLGAANVPGGQEALIFGEYTGAGVAGVFDLNVLNSSGGANELMVVHYFGLATANGIFPAPLPFLDPVTGNPYLGAFTGAADTSMWDSQELRLEGRTQSSKSPEFWYFDALQGSALIRHYNLPMLPGVADITKVMFALNPSVGTHQMLGDRINTPRLQGHSIKAGLAAAETFTVGGTDVPNAKRESLLQWSNVQSQQQVSIGNSPVGGITARYTTPIPEVAKLQPDYYIGSNGTLRSMAAIVTAVLLGRRWITDTQYNQLVDQDVWTHNTPVLPSGRMRVRKISGGRMRIRVVGSGSADA